jgi:hypothetical protein
MRSMALNSLPACSIFWFSALLLPEGAIGPLPPGEDVREELSTLVMYEIPKRIRNTPKNAAIQICVFVIYFTFFCEFYFSMYSTFL